jgi:hypothetical protein
VGPFKLSVGLNGASLELLDLTLRDPQSPRNRAQKVLLVVGTVGRHTADMAFQPHPEYQERKTSASALIKLVLENKKPEILPEHLRELLTTLLWKLTEAESHNKYSTRYQTEGAMACRAKSKLRHEHVYQRNQMIGRLLNAKLEEVDGILENAVGCTVTIDEHSRLAKSDDEYGWERYRKAGLVVIDTATGERWI